MLRLVELSDNLPPLGILNTGHSSEGIGVIPVMGMLNGVEVLLVLLVLFLMLAIPAGALVLVYFLFLKGKNWRGVDNSAPTDANPANTPNPANPAPVQTPGRNRVASDFRLAIIFTALGLGIVVAFGIMGSKAWGLGMIPICLGLGYAVSGVATYVRK